MEPIRLSLPALVARRSFSKALVTKPLSSGKTDPWNGGRKLEPTFDWLSNAVPIQQFSPHERRVVAKLAVGGLPGGEW